MATFRTFLALSHLSAHSVTICKISKSRMGLPGRAWGFTIPKAADCPGCTDPCKMVWMFAPCRRVSESVRESVCVRESARARASEREKERVSVREFLCERERARESERERKSVCVRERE